MFSIYAEPMTDVEGLIHIQVPVDSFSDEHHISGKITLELSNQYIPGHSSFGLIPVPRQFADKKFLADFMYKYEHGLYSITDKLMNQAPQHVHIPVRMTSS